MCEFYFSWKKIEHFLLRAFLSPSTEKSQDTSWKSMIRKCTLAMSRSVVLILTLTHHLFLIFEMKSYYIA